METLYYFAYGSNLWWRRLKQRVPSAEPLLAAVLRGFALRFRKIGADGSAKADLQFTGHASHVVHGMVYTMAACDLEVLDRIEGGYHRASVCIEHERDEAWAFTYLATEPASRVFAPFDWYRELIVAGGHAHRLPASYLAGVAAVTAVPDPDPGRRRRNWPHPVAPGPG